MSDGTAQRMLEELRRNFDQSFAAPAATASTGLVDLLAITVCGHPYALRLRELTAVFCDKGVTPLPTSVPSLVGLTAARGTLLAVHSLASLLGHERVGGERWMVVLRARVALSFERFDGHLRLTADRIEAASSDRLVAGSVRSGGSVRPVLDAEKMLELLGDLAGRTRGRQG